MNPNEDLIENVLTEKKKAIVVVHHTGLGAEIDKIMKLADSHNPVVVEESVQGLLSYYKFRHLGTFGETGCFSFHETKNMQYVESGAILLNINKWMDIFFTFNLVEPKKLHISCLNYGDHILWN